MLKWLPLPLSVAVTFLVMLVALLFVVLILLFPVILIKILVPIPAVRRLLTRYLIFAASLWTGANFLIYRALLPVRWTVELPPGLDPKRSYLIISNHQSWADILILFDVFYRCTPWLRFFMKQELIWVPLIGQVCWGMDFPFMKRHSREAIERNPALAKQDLETTRLFCERYRGEPITVVNFLDGTRFTEAKRIAKKSPYRNLLRPKAAGMSFTLNAMGEQFGGIIDVTICYQPHPRGPLWSFLGGRQPDIVVRSRLRPIEREWLTGDYQNDPVFREHFQQVVNGWWVEKDQELDQLKSHWV
jgi:1-acyl-sn-glycerol-3-phosphate acyltransferase